MGQKEATILKDCSVGSSPFSVEERSFRDAALLAALLLFNAGKDFCFPLSLTFGRSVICRKLSILVFKGNRN